MTIAKTSPVEVIVTFAECELRIEEGTEMLRAGSPQVGEALRTIRDHHAAEVRGRYGTFERYLRERWGMGKSQGYRLIEAAGMVGQLSPMGDTQPTSERQLRPLSKLPESDRPAAWEQATERAHREGYDAPIARHVAEVVEEIRTPDITPETKAARWAVIAVVSALDDLTKAVSMDPQTVADEVRSHHSAELEPRLEATINWLSRLKEIL